MGEDPDTYRTTLPILAARRKTIPAISENVIWISATRRRYNVCWTHLNLNRERSNLVARENAKCMPKEPFPVHVSNFVRSASAEEHDLGVGKTYRSITDDPQHRTGLGKKPSMLYLCTNLTWMNPSKSIATRRRNYVNEDKNDWDAFVQPLTFFTSPKYIDRQTQLQLV